MPTSQQDCHFFLQGSCRNGDQCQFRHSQAARSTEEVCPAYAQTGNCPQQDCGKRHTGNAHRATKGPQEIQCRNEENGGVCTRPGCHFKHLRPQGVPNSNPVSVFGRPPRPSTLNAGAKVFVPRQTSGEFEDIAITQFRPRRPAQPATMSPTGGQGTAQQSAFATQARPNPRAQRPQFQKSPFQQAGAFGASAFKGQQKPAFQGQQKSAFQPRQPSALQSQQTSAFGTSMKSAFKGNSTFASGQVSAFGSTGSTFGVQAPVVSTSTDDVEMGDDDGGSALVPAPTATSQPPSGFGAQSVFGQTSSPTSAFAAKSASIPPKASEPTQQQTKTTAQKRELQKQLLKAKLEEKKRQLEIQKQQQQQQSNLGAKVWVRPTEQASEQEPVQPPRQQENIGAKVWVRPTEPVQKPAKLAPPKKPQTQPKPSVTKPFVPLAAPSLGSTSSQHIKSIYDILQIQEESPQIPKKPVRKRIPAPVPAPNPFSAAAWAPTPEISASSSLAPPTPAKKPFVRSPSPSPSPMLRARNNIDLPESGQHSQLPSYEGTPSEYASPASAVTDEQANFDSYSYSEESAMDDAATGSLAQETFVQETEESADQEPELVLNQSTGDSDEQASTSPTLAAPDVAAESAGTVFPSVPFDSTQAPPTDLLSESLDSGEKQQKKKSPKLPKKAPTPPAATPLERTSTPSPNPSTDPPVPKVRSFQEIMAEKRRKKEQATMLAAGLAHSDADTTADTPRDSPPAGIKAAPPATPEKRQREEDAPIETKRTKLTHTKVKTPRREVPNYVAMFEREMADIDMADLSGPLSSSSSNDRILSADLTGYHMEASLDQLLNS